MISYFDFQLMSQEKTKIDKKSSCRHRKLAPSTFLFTVCKASRAPSSQPAETERNTCSDLQFTTPLIQNSMPNPTQALHICDDLSNTESTTLFSWPGLITKPVDSVFYTKPHKMSYVKINASTAKYTTTGGNCPRAPPQITMPTNKPPGKSQDTLCLITTSLAQHRCVPKNIY